MAAIIVGGPPRRKSVLKRNEVSLSSIHRSRRASGRILRSASLWEVVARIDAIAGTEIDQGILALLHLNPEAPFRRADVVVGHLVDARWDLLELVVAVAIRPNMEAHALGGAVR